MKPRLDLGSRSARSIHVLPVVVAAMALGAGTGCSSSSAADAGPGGPGGDGGGDAGTPGFGPAVDGGGMPCAPRTTETVGSKISLTVTWPTTLANAGCDSTMTPPCSGTINIWLLAHYDISGSNVTGTTITCGNQTPDIPLTPTGTQSEGVTSGTARVQVSFDPSVWTGIAKNMMKAPTSTSGLLGGWAIGSSLQINPTNSVYGLADTSMYAKAATVWPGSESAIMRSDITDDDMDGHPGITATPSSAMGYSLPATAAQLTPPFAPQADQLYLALRTSLALYGTSTSCNEVSGSVGVQLLNNHVIGCRLANDAGDCTMGQWDFIDSNTTVYLGPGVKVPLSVLPPSFEPPGISGTFTAKIFDADAGNIDCSTVLSTFK